MYKRILVPLDASPTASSGLEEAIRLAHALRAKLHLFHVVDLHLVYMDYNGTAELADYVHALREAGQELLHKAQALAARQDVSAEVHAEECRTAETINLILQEARRTHADLLVIGTHGLRGFQRLVMGSTAEGVARLSPVPVLLVRGPAA
ncbi:universal stress protein [Chitinimonas prasina]|uniref:Universal stress protein n=1 Tax=Chitinimonas prasina TaxID=1434937 RepID=A0ABQ5YI99_9NEIS|nr:universal stress protein [Chitinimonas prasina]GLR13713.1 universal stress protein [Chitinimonas prasina]